jgi:hypothetical protein
MTRRPEVSALARRQRRLDEQKRDHNRSIAIIHIDQLVKWIVDSGLINDLRHALDELQIPILDKPE